MAVDGVGFGADTQANNIQQQTPMAAARDTRAGEWVREWMTMVEDCGLRGGVQKKGGRRNFYSCPPNRLRSPPIQAAPIAQEINTTPRK